MSGRDAILGNIRRALGREALPEERRAALAARLEAPSANLIPARAQLPGPERLDLFVRLALAQNATVDRVESLALVPAAIADYLLRHNLPTRIRRSPDPSLDAIPWSERPMLDFVTGRAEGADQVGLTPAFAAVAETATLVMVSGPDTPATINFLPDTHLVVLKAEDVVGAYEDAIARLRRQGGGSGGFMPRSVNLITGPSRTADIEQELILGAHGPRRLHIVLVDGEEA